MLNYDEICRVDVPEGMSGVYKVEKFKFPEKETDVLVTAKMGRPIAPGIYTRLMRWRWTIRNMQADWKVVMSDVPTEIEDHYRVLNEAQYRGGRVLINGLGLGMVLKGILSFPNVTHVDVVEKSSDVIKLIAPTYTLDPRLTIHQGDAYSIEWPPGSRWNVVWHDIWDEVVSYNVPGMNKLHAKYKDLCDWQDSWRRFECQTDFVDSEYKRR